MSARMASHRAKKMIAAADKLFAAGAKLKKFLYLSHSRENNKIPKSGQAFTSLLGLKAPSQLRWKFEYLPADNHGSTPARAIYNGLESLFAGWSLPEDGIPTAPDLERRYSALTEEFGFPCRPAEDRIVGLAYTLLRRKKTDEAASRMDLALESCRIACRLAEQYVDTRLVAFQKHLENVKAKQANK